MGSNIVGNVWFTELKKIKNLSFFFYSAFLPRDPKWFTESIIQSGGSGDMAVNYTWMPNCNSQFLCGICPACCTP